MSDGMKLVNGFWLPATEEHLVDFLKSGPKIHHGPTYQFHKLAAALKHVPADRRRTCIDVGAHCGLWSRVLAKEFNNVAAFEPVPLHRACFMRNVPDHNVSLQPFALGNKEDDVTLHSGPNSSGDTYVQSGGEHSAHMYPLDHFQLTLVDFIKIDCEGYEYFIIEGAENTIKTWKPTIIVEQKPKKGSQFGLSDTAACDLLRSWGAVKQFEMSGDYCFTWNK